MMMLANTRCVPRAKEKGGARKKGLFRVGWHPSAMLARALYPPHVSTPPCAHHVRMSMIHLLPRSNSAAALWAKRREQRGTRSGGVFSVLNQGQLLLSPARLPLPPPPPLSEPALLLMLLLTRPDHPSHPLPQNKKNHSSASAAARPASARKTTPAVVVRAALPNGNDRPKFGASINKSLPKLESVELPKIDSEEINAKLTQAGDALAKAWDKTENKPTAVFFGAVALVALIAASSVVNTVEGIPVVGDGLKLVGIGATAFFSYKYLVWPQDREQLVAHVKALFGKIGL